MPLEALSTGGGRYDRIAHYACIGVLETDSSEEALRKQTLVLFATVITLLSTVWVTTYWMLGLRVPASIPFAYQVISIANLATFAKKKRYRSFRTCQLGLTLALPFLLQLSLGGFIASSGVVLWSFTAPLGALLFASRRDAARWFGAFCGLILLAAALEASIATTDADVPGEVATSFFALNMIGVTGTSFLLLHYFVRERDRAAALVAAERERSERLLLNVLPAPIAERLKSGESPIADRAPEVGVLFADIVSFTPLSETIPPDQIIGLLDEVFTRFDELAAEHGLEKIKTIGDAYMVASGLLHENPRHAVDLAEVALEMRATIEQTQRLEVRIGIDIGPVVAGVIGRRKFSYDLWGDTVNTAARMESHGIPGAIQVTERAYHHLARMPFFVLCERGVIDVKGKGPMRTYLLLERVSAGKVAAGDQAPVAGHLHVGRRPYPKGA